MEYQSKLMTKEKVKNFSNWIDVNIKTKHEIIELDDNSFYINLEDLTPSELNYCIDYQNDRGGIRTEWERQ